jgi:hypothetical protein
MRAAFSICGLAAAFALLSHTGVAASLGTVGSFSGSTGYVEGRPIVAGGVLYGVLGYPPPPSGSTLTGSVYAFTPTAGGSAYTLATIASFTGGSGGGNPIGGLHIDTSGHLYGAAFSGGNTSASACKADGLDGCGTIFQLTKSGTSWTNTAIWTFSFSDGASPVGNLIADSSGALYGVTENGGCADSLFYPDGCGVVFKLTPPASGSTWTRTVLYSFVGGASDGANPLGPLARDAAGNLYGVTQFGGTSAEGCSTLPTGAGDGRCGTVFKLTYNSSAGTYKESILHFFSDGSDGSIPSSGVVLDKTGNVYGTTLQGGNGGTCDNFGYSGCGVVFELAAASGYAKTNVHSFNGADGATPSALSINSKNHLFGVTSQNSSSETCNASVYYCGTAFELVYSGGTWNETVLHKFAGTSNKVTGPEFGLAANTLGELFGVSINDVTSTVFTLTGVTP